MDRLPAITFRPWRHPLVLGTAVMFVAGWGAMAADNFMHTYDPGHLWLARNAWCDTTPGKIFFRPTVDWTGHYDTKVRCPSPEQALRYPDQPWKWSHTEPPIDVNIYVRQGAPGERRRHAYR